MKKPKISYVVQEKEVMTGRNGRRYYGRSQHKDLESACSWIERRKASRNVQPTKFRIIKRTEEVVQKGTHEALDLIRRVDIELGQMIATRDARIRALEEEMPSPNFLLFVSRVALSRQVLNKYDARQLHNMAICIKKVMEK